MAIPWSAPTYSSQRHQRGDHRDTTQVQREKLDRASRLLLGAMIEAYDVLSQLQGEMGCEVEQNTNIPVLRQFVEDINTHSQTITYLSQSGVKTEPVVTRDKPVLANTDITVEAHTDGDSQGDSHGDCQSDGVTSEPQQCVGDLTSLPDIVPNITSDITSLPDLIPHSNINSFNKTPKISWRPKRNRPKFKISKSVEVDKVRRSERRPKMSWREAGVKLCDLADNLTSTGFHPEDGTSRQDRHSVDQQKSDTDHLINNVFKCVQAVGLLLIMKKIDNMLK